MPLPVQHLGRVLAVRSGSQYRQGQGEDVAKSLTDGRRRAWPEGDPEFDAIQRPKKLEFREQPDEAEKALQHRDG